MILIDACVTPDSIWDDVGGNLAKLRGAGITVPFPDVVLTTIAIENGHEIWSRDAHFAIMQRALPALKLFAEQV